LGKDPEKQKGENKERERRRGKQKGMGGYLLHLIKGV